MWFNMQSMDKVALVTGSAKGLGKSIALALAKDGFAVAIHCRRSAGDAKKLEGEINRISRSIIVSGDLTRESEVSGIFAKVDKEFGRLDVLVNNVGNFLYKKFEDTSNLEFRDVIESNVYSTLYSSREALKIMRRQKSGYIINIGSVGSERLTIRQKSVPYFLAKNAVYVLTKTMAWEEAKNGVHINMVSPASLKEDIFKKRDFPMGRAAKYNDVESAIRFLISPDAYYINGANIEVAGGFVPGMV